MSCQEMPLRADVPDCSVAPCISTEPLMHWTASCTSQLHHHGLCAAWMMNWTQDAMLRPLSPQQCACLADMWVQLAKRGAPHASCWPPSSTLITAWSSACSLGSAMDSQRARIAAIARLCGGTAEQTDAYPGWAPNPQSPVLQVGTLQCHCPLTSPFAEHRSKHICCC